MLISSSGLFIVIAALMFDALIGDPEWLWRRVGHPVTLIGALIDTLDRKFNRGDQTPEQRRSEGINSTAILVVIAATVGVLIQVVVQSLPAGNIILALIASIFIAQRSLYQHVAGVRAAFAEGGLPAAREAVAMIVGRDPATLDEAGIARAAIESLAENTSDGVVAPLFWGALFGLTSVIIAMIIPQARIWLTMSHDGLLPKVFGVVHPKFRTPHISTLITGVCAATLGGCLPIGILGELVSIGTLIAFIVVCAGVLVLRYTRPDLKRPFRVKWIWFVSLMGVLFCAAMAASLPSGTWLRLILWSVLGILIYLFYGYRNSRLRVAQDEQTQEPV